MSENSQVESHTSYYTKNGLIVFLPVILYIVFGATMYQWIEGFRPIDSYYFVVITLSTIGYGDIYPHTDLGKIFTIFFVIIGLALFSGLISTLVNRAKARKERRLGTRAVKQGS
jgi:hypothetical protein